MSEQNQNNSKNKSATSSSANNAANTPEASKPMQGAQAVHTSTWRKLLSKRWVFPALYMAAAAIILTLVWVYQDMNRPLDPNAETAQVDHTVVDSGTQVEGTVNEDAVEVVASNETLGWPVKDAQEVDVVMSFYDETASKEEQAAALIEFEQTFTPNVGIDLARKDQKSFDVLSAMSGKVIRAEQHPKKRLRGGSGSRRRHEDGLSKSGGCQSRQRRYGQEGRHARHGRTQRAGEGIGRARAL